MGVMKVVPSSRIRQTRRSARWRLGVLLPVVIAFAACTSSASSPSTTSRPLATSHSATSTTTKTPTQRLPSIPFSALPSPPCPSGYDPDGVSGTASYMCVPYAYLPGGTLADPNNNTTCPTGSHSTMGPVLCVLDTAAEIVAPVAPPVSTHASRCLPARMKAAKGERIGGASQELAMLIVLTNEGAGPCMLDGYPRVQLVTATGTDLRLSQVAQVASFVTSVRPHVVLLRPGGVAYVLVAQFACALGSLKQAAVMRLSLPGAADDTAVSIPSAEFALCKGGTTPPQKNVIAVTPVEPTIQAVLP